MTIKQGPPHKLLILCDKMQSISRPTSSVNGTRALNRLQSVFVTLDKNIDADRRHEFNLYIDLWKRWENDFCHPMSHSSGHSTTNAAYEAQLTSRW